MVPSSSSFPGILHSLARTFAMTGLRKIHCLIPTNRLLIMGVLLTSLAACTSSNQPVVDQTAVLEAQRAADEAEARRLAEERARNEAAEAERLRQEALAQAEAARAQEQARLAREAQEREALAAAQRRDAQAREQAQRDRIAALEAQIAELRDSTSRVNAANERLEQAVAAAEQLLEALNAEQLKYGNTDAAGQPVDPLDKERIAELEERKDSLKQEAQALVTP
jgi:fused signal recognition particle receptor